MPFKVSSEVFGSYTNADFIASRKAVANLFKTRGIDSVKQKLTWVHNLFNGSYSYFAFCVSLSTEAFQIPDIKPDRSMWALMTDGPSLKPDKPVVDLLLFFTYGNLVF